MKDAKLNFDPLARAESIMARQTGDPARETVECREQIRDLIALSQAQSLKRIADAMSDGGVFKQPINSYGECIGDAIQGQLVRGQAGISQYNR